MENGFVAGDGGREHTQAAHDFANAFIARGPVVEPGHLFAQDIDEKGLMFVLAAPMGQVVATDEGPADPLEVVDELVLDVALFGDSGHGLFYL